MSPIQSLERQRQLHQKRKKWTEEEERTLITKYAEMAADGSLARLRTREKRFRPLAAHVNSIHHDVDRSAFPHHWSWKDASTKVQNMRHQFLLAKQKLVHSEPGPDADGVNYWPNFLLYKSVFGDIPLPSNGPVPAAAPGAADLSPDNSWFNDGFDCEDVDAVAPILPLPPPLPKRRKKKRKVWEVLEAEMSRLREWEERMEERDMIMEEERRERERRRREEEREWEEKMDVRREEWRKRMEGVMAQHRVEMEQLQARMVHEQQGAVNQVLGIVAQWAGGGGFGDGTSWGSHHHHQQQQHQQQQQQNHYVVQMMQSLHQMNEIVHGDNRVGSDSPDDQFIVD